MHPFIHRNLDTYIHTYMYIHINTYIHTYNYTNKSSSIIVIPSIFHCKFHCKFPSIILPIIKTVSNCLVVLFRASVCCGDLGCFSDSPPWDHLSLPECATWYNPELRLYTRNNIYDYSLLTRTTTG